MQTQYQIGIGLISFILIGYFIFYLSSLKSFSYAKGKILNSDENDEINKKIVEEKNKKKLHKLELSKNRKLNKNFEKELKFEKQRARRFFWGKITIYLIWILLIVASFGFLYAEATGKSLSNAMRVLYPLMSLVSVFSSKFYPEFSTKREMHQSFFNFYQKHKYKIEKLTIDENSDINLVLKANRFITNVLIHGREIKENYQKKYISFDDISLNQIENGQSSNIVSDEN